MWPSKICSLTPVRERHTVGLLVFESKCEEGLCVVQVQRNPFTPVFGAVSEWGPLRCGDL